MKYRQKQDKGTFLTAALKSRNFQGIYFSSENLELYSYCSILELKLFCIPLFYRSTERALGPFDRQLCLQNWVLKVSQPVVFNKVLKKTKTRDVQGLG